MISALFLLFAGADAWRVGGGDRLRQTFQADSALPLPVATNGSVVGVNVTVIDDNIVGQMRAAPATHYQ